MITANNRYSGNNCYSGIKGPDHFFHYSGRCLYLRVWIVRCEACNEDFLPLGDRLLDHLSDFVVVEVAGYHVLVLSLHNGLRSLTQFY